MNKIRLAACIAVLATLVGVRSVNAGVLDEGAERYRPYMIEGIGDALAEARVLCERAAASDLAGAKKAWILARAGWERSEVFTTGFVPELDAQIDAWPNADSGFHAIEAKLFGAGQTNVDGDAAALVEHLNDLHIRLKDMKLTPQGLLDGTVRLAYEVGESKADGGESSNQRYVARRHAQQHRRHRFRIPHDFLRGAQHGGWQARRDGNESDRAA